MKKLRPNTFRPTILSSIIPHCKLDSTFTLRDVEKVINKIGLKGTKPSQLAHNLKRDGYIRQMGKGKFEMRWTTVTQLIKLGMFV